MFRLIHALYAFFSLFVKHYCFWQLVHVINNQYPKITFVIGVCFHVKHVHCQGHSRESVEMFGKPNG
jgi:hypothetical protein